MIWPYYALLVLGFIVLIKGADFLVDGSSSIARKNGISPIVIGLTIVAFGTSAPELVVNIMASISGNSQIAIGNIFGSNISNILLILGITAIVKPLAVKSGTTWKEIPLNLLSIAAIGVLANDLLIDGRTFSEISRIDGLILIMFFSIFIYYTFGISKVTEQDVEQKIKVYKWYVSAGMIFLGLAGLTLGGKWIVDSAVIIASGWGVSEALIGLTIVAIGTSLPELATSLVAAVKGNIDIAVGNVVGSNIFNIFWVLGLSSIIKPLTFDIALNFDIMIIVAATLMLFVFMFIGKRRILQRWQGIVFVCFYVLYLGILIVRG